MSVLNSNAEDGTHGKSLVLYHQCGWCGKKFYMRHPSMWRYKETFKGKTTHFCSWGCLSNARKHAKVRTTDGGTITYGAPTGTWERTENTDE